jgi:hypothetical protein
MCQMIAFGFHSRFSLPFHINRFSFRASHVMFQPSEQRPPFTLRWRCLQHIGKAAQAHALARSDLHPEPVTWIFNHSDAHGIWLPIDSILRSTQAFLESFETGDCIVEHTLNLLLSGLLLELNGRYPMGCYSFSLPRFSPIFPRSYQTSESLLSRPTKFPVKGGENNPRNEENDFQ